MDGPFASLPAVSPSWHGVGVVRGGSLAFLCRAIRAVQFLAASVAIGASNPFRTIDRVVVLDLAVAIAALAFKVDRAMKCGVPSHVKAWSMSANYRKPLCGLQMFSRNITGLPIIAESAA
jgi:hypothetical protein